MTFPDFHHPETGNAARFGGKSAHLSGLARGGFPLPAGFAIPVDALLEWQTPLLPRIEAEVAALGSQDEQGVADRILQLFLAQPLGLALRDHLAASCEKHLPDGLGTLVAVRSSAVGEDAAEASFAGQFESLLGVQGLEGIDRALRTVWASLYSPRAIRYRHRAGLPYAASPMGVAILEMVDAVASGVAFSVDVVTGKRDRVVIESTHGLAEPVVQGEVIPDRLVLDKAETRLMLLTIGSKASICRLSRTGGTVTTETAADLQTQSSLRKTEAEDLARIVTRLEKTFGHPVDVEWAMASDRKVKMLQVRPVSTLLPIGAPLLWDRTCSLPGSD